MFFYTGNLSVARSVCRCFQKGPVEKWVPIYLRGGPSGEVHVRISKA